MKHGFTREEKQDMLDAHVDGCHDELPREGCSPKRYGKMGVMHCPHGCVTECALLACPECERQRGRDQPIKLDGRL